MRRSWRVVASRGREGASAVSRRREAGHFSGEERGRCGGVLHNGFREGRGGKRVVKHGKSGLRAAICALFGTSRGDLCKTVEKLCKSLQGVKTKITNCAQRFVRLCVLLRELCKYRFLSAFGVWALRCGGAPFGRFPSRLRRRVSHLGGGGAAVDRLPRGERTGRGGVGLLHFHLCAQRFGTQAALFGTPAAWFGTPAAWFGTEAAVFGTQVTLFGTQATLFGTQAALFGTQATWFGTPAAWFGTQAAVFGTARGGVRLCLPPSPTLRTAARDAVPQRRKGEAYIYREGEAYIIYTRAQARRRERFAQGGEQRCG